MRLALRVLLRIDQNDNNRMHGWGARRIAASEASACMGTRQHAQVLEAIAKKFLYPHPCVPFLPKPFLPQAGR